MRTEEDEQRDERILYRIKKRKLEDSNDLFEDDLGIYSPRERDAALDEDEIATWEAGFMQGWDEAA